MTTPLRPQQYRLSWPLTPSQVEGLDAMLETLFKRLRAVDLAASTHAGGSGDFDDQMVGNVVGRFPFNTATGEDGEWGAPGTAGGIGPQGPQGFPGQDGQNGDDASAYQTPDTISSLFTQGSVIFAGPSGKFAQNNANFFWDDTGKRLGIGITTGFGSSNTLLAVYAAAGTKSAIIEYGVNGTSVAALVGAEGAASSIINGSIERDFSWRIVQPRSLLFSTDNGSTIAVAIDSSGRVNIGNSRTATAVLQLKAGTATASTAPLKFTSGTVLTTAEAGAIEFTTDDFFATITTGAARKAFVLDDGSRLTSGQIPKATTNGRLVNGYTASALTQVDDTNVTLALGGTPATSLLAAVSLTLGWTGTLAVARGGTGLGSGTSGGVLAFTAAGTLASSAALAANALTLGGGAGVVPFTDSHWTIEQTGNTLSSTTQPRGAVTNSAAQSISSATETALTFDTNIDAVPATIHSTSSNTSRLVVPTGAGGVYLLSASAFFGASGTGIRYIYFRKNGTTAVGGLSNVIGSAANGLTCVLPAQVTLVAGDYIEVMAFQSSGGNLNVGSNSGLGSGGAVWAGIVKLW